jgi:hypothetical protein
MSTPYITGTGVPANVVEQFHERGFREVDAQFNVGQLEGFGRWGVDLVNPATKERMLVTEPSDPVGEDAIRLGIGEHAVLETLEHAGDHSLYRVPRGARLLARTLMNPPYEPLYMKLLTIRAKWFLDNLQTLEEDRLGIGPERVAVAHNGIELDDEDDAFFTAVPPIHVAGNFSFANQEALNEHYDQLRLQARRMNLGRRIGRTVLKDMFTRHEGNLERDKLWDWLRGEGEE